MGDRKIFSYPSPLKGRKILLPNIHVSFADSPSTSDIMQDFCFPLADSFALEVCISTSQLQPKGFKRC